MNPFYIEKIGLSTAFEPRCNDYFRKYEYTFSRCLTSCLLLMVTGDKGILRAEVKLTKPKAIREYADASDVVSQITKIVKCSADIFMETFARVVPFGDFHKMTAAVEIIRSEVKDSIMRRRMLRLLTLIPEKKSLHLARKAMNCRSSKQS